MGILDQVSGALGGGGVKAILMQQLIAYLSKPGALGNLTAAFQQHGLGNLLQSWIGSGQNLPISPAQVQQVLGGNVLGQMAKAANVGEQDAAKELSSLLPSVIDKITPDGKEPSSDKLGGLLSSVGKLLG
jgi:uncharacterized protein YidB (DUF937 family)